MLVLFVLVGVITELRAVCQDRPKGDLMVFLRTAWAVRAGLDIYAVTDHNGWHYHYPPLLAIAMTPLANPPPYDPMPGTLPYPVSVAVWYTFNVVLLVLATHMLAGALAEATSPTMVRGSRRWWLARGADRCLLAADHSHLGPRPGRRLAAFPAVRCHRRSVEEAKRAGRSLAGRHHLPESHPRVSVALSAVAPGSPVPGRLCGGFGGGTRPGPGGGFRPGPDGRLLSRVDRGAFYCRPWPKGTTISAIMN